MKLFTNGTEDYDLVIRKYKESYQLLTQTTSLDYRSAGAWGPKEIDMLIEVIPDFLLLRTFNLAWARLNTEQAQRLAAALQKCPHAKNLEFYGNGLGLCGQLAMLRMWNSKVRCWMSSLNCCCFCWCCCASQCCCSRCPAGSGLWLLAQRMPCGCDLCGWAIRALRRRAGLTN